MISAGCGESTEPVDTELTTLPPLPSVSIMNTAESSPGTIYIGYTGASDSGNYAAVGYDTAGNVVWHYITGYRMVDVQPQPNGNITLFSAPRDREGMFYEVNTSGMLVATHIPSSAPESGVHEFRLLPNGYLTYAVLRDTVDAGTIGSGETMEIKQCIAEYLHDGKLFTWSTGEGMELSDSYNPLSGSEINPYHINALDLDRDGTLLISMRNASQIVKVDPANGKVVWRLGGIRNQFTFIDDPQNGFSRQHGIRRLDNGNIILFDNGNDHTPALSRAVEYQLDEVAKTARMVWEYRDRSLFASAMGFAQRLSNGNTLICYGTARVVREVTPVGTVVWELRVDGEEMPYRAFKVE